MEQDGSQASAEPIANTTPPVSLKKRALKSLKLSLPKALVQLFDSSDKPCQQADPQPQGQPALREHRRAFPTTPLRTAKSFFGSVSPTRGASATTNPPSNGNCRAGTYRNSVSSTSKSLREKFRRPTSRSTTERSPDADHWHSSPIAIPDAVRRSNPIRCRPALSDLSGQQDNPLRQRMLSSPESETKLPLVSKSISPCFPPTMAMSPMAGATFDIEDIEEPPVPFEQAYENVSKVQRDSTTGGRSSEYSRTTAVQKPCASLMPTQDPFVDSSKSENIIYKSNLKITRPRSRTYDCGYVSVLEGYASVPDVTNPNKFINMDPPARSDDEQDDVLETEPHSGAERSTHESLDKQTPPDTNLADRGSPWPSHVIYIETETSANGISEDTLKEVVPTDVGPTADLEHDRLDAWPLRENSQIPETPVIKPQIHPSLEHALSEKTTSQVTKLDPPIWTVRHVYRHGTFFGSRTERPIRARHTFANIHRVHSPEHDVPFSARGMIVISDISVPLIPASQDSSTDTDESSGRAPRLSVWRPVSKSRSTSGSSWLSATTVDIDDALKTDYSDGGRLRRLPKVENRVLARNDAAINESLD